MKGGRGLSTVVVMLILLARASAQEAPFYRGNEAFANQDYAGAIAAYEEAVAAGGEGFSLRFNLGTAYLFAGQHGPALWQYRLAERFAPRDEDLAANLAIARSRRTIDVAPPALPQAVALLLWPHHKLAVSEAVTAWIALSLLGAVLLHAWVIRRSPWLLRAAVPLLALGLALAVSLAVRTTRSIDEAVVLRADAEVRTGPSVDGYPLHFRLQEGAEIDVLEVRADGWLKIEARTGSDAQRGYMQATDVGLL